MTAPQIIAVATILIVSAFIFWRKLRKPPQPECRFTRRAWRDGAFTDIYDG